MLTHLLFKIDDSAKASLVRFTPEEVDVDRIISETDEQEVGKKGTRLHPLALLMVKRANKLTFWIGNEN